MKIKWGRLYKPDKRDKKFLMKPDFKLAEQVAYKYWPCGNPLDQGSTPQCVAYAGYKWLTSAPIRNFPPWKPAYLYDRCQENDEWPGNNYDGTSVRGLFKWLNHAGYSPRYEWAFDVHTLVAHLLTEGPVVVGTDWKSGMLKTDSKGFIHVTGSVEGGHGYLLYGCNRVKEKIAIINSWGMKWGINGRAWISFDDMQKLLDAQGECAHAVEVKL